MSLLSINPTLCKKDGICSLVCPTKLIKGVKNELPVEQAGRSCLQCGQCMAFCPHEAITVKALADIPLLPINKKFLPKAESVEHLLQSRRSIRQYKKNPVAQETLQKILDVASYAPTAKNERNIRYAVVYDAKSMKALGDCIAKCLAADKENSVIPEGQALARGWEHGQDYILRGAPHLIVAVCPKSWYWHAHDCTINLSYIEIAAVANGLGTCWGGYVTVCAAAFAPVRKILGIADDEIVGGVQLIGIPSLQRKNIAPRKPHKATWL